MWTYWPITNATLSTLGEAARWQEIFDAVHERYLAVGISHNKWDVNDYIDNWFTAANFNTLFAEIETIIPHYVSSSYIENTLDHIPLFTVGDLVPNGWSLKETYEARYSVDFNQLYTVLNALTRTKTTATRVVGKNYSKSVNGDEAQKKVGGGLWNFGFGTNIKARELVYKNWNTYRDTYPESNLAWGYSMCICAAQEDNAGLWYGLFDSDWAEMTVTTPIETAIPHTSALHARLRDNWWAMAEYQNWTPVDRDWTSTVWSNPFGITKEKFGLFDDNADDKTGSNPVSQVAANSFDTAWPVDEQCWAIWAPEYYADIGQPETHDAVWITTWDFTQ